MSDDTFTLADHGLWRCADCAELYSEPQAGDVCDSCREEV